jgi:NAD(P)H-dependent FMN reductase
MAVLRIIIASTRPGRVGLPVGNWFADVARAHGGFDVEVTDLAELGLPFMDEPKHPRFREYTHDHTRAWSEEVDASDAFVFVMPEYNFGINAPLKNAIDFLHHEWHDKPVGFVSYGGVAAGTRAVQMTKQIVSALKMLPVYEAVYIPFVASRIEDGRFNPSDVTQDAAGALLDELVRVEAGLHTLRATATAP